MRQFVVVYHNNSTHYLVGYQETLDSKTAVLLRSYQYSNGIVEAEDDEEQMDWEERVQEIYVKALTDAVGWARRF